MRRWFTGLAAAFALLAVALSGCSGGDERDGGLTLADRWLRVGEDLGTGVRLYDHALPPDLSDLLNPGSDAGATASDRVSLPVHPQATLLGSYQLQNADGTSVLWLIYDVAGVGAEVARTIAQQLDQSPWQVVGGQGDEAMTVVRFQNSRSSELDGSAVVQERPSTSEFKLTVARGGRETALTVSRSATVPTIEGALGPDLTVTRVAAGAARTAGMLVGDRLVRVNDAPVTSKATLDAALRGLASSGTRRSSIAYVVQIRLQTPTEVTFLPPPVPLSLPATFPAAEAWRGMAVLDFGWGTQPGGKGFHATLVSEDSSTVVANRVRDALKAAGWEILGDTPLGFATQLSIAHRGDGYVGQVSIDTLPQDSEYVQVQVQIQTGTAPAP